MHLHVRNSVVLPLAQALVVAIINMGRGWPTDKAEGLPLFLQGSERHKKTGDRLPLIRHASISAASGMLSAAARSRRVFNNPSLCLFQHTDGTLRKSCGCGERALGEFSPFTKGAQAVLP